MNYCLLVIGKVLSVNKELTLFKIITLWNLISFSTKILTQKASM